jgi:CRP-like cAMP-binding protein
MQRSTDSVRVLLGAVQLFSECSDAELEVLGSVALPVHFAPGEVISRQGARHGRCVIVGTGTAEVVVDGARVGTIGPGDPVGDLQVLGDERAGATVTVLTPVEGLAIDHTRLEQVLARAPALTLTLLRTAAARLQRVALIAGKITS